MELSDNSAPVIFDLMKTHKHIAGVTDKFSEDLNQYFEKQDEALEEDKSD